MKLFLFIVLATLPCMGKSPKRSLCERQMLGNEAAAELITVITTTNPIPSIPTTKHIYPSQKSLFQIPAFALCKKIIVFDGINPWFTRREADYEQYKKNVIALTESDPYFANTELIFCDQWVHLAGAIAEAMKRVTTPFVFIHQHDFVLTRPFNVGGVITSMLLNPGIKHVRLHVGHNTAYAGWWDGPVDEVVEGGSCVPLCRTFGWSDNDHIARTDYYLNFVLPMCQHGAMEWFLQPAIQQAVSEQGASGHAPFGTYLYGEIWDGGYIRHTDGREAWGLQE